MRIPIKNLYYLLSYAWDKLNQADNMQVSQDDYNNSLDLLARLFISGANRLLKKGLDKSYFEEADEYTGIKGKLVFNETLNRQLHKNGKTFCQFDTYTANVTKNQILKSTMRLLTKIPELDRELNSDAWACFYRFSEIDDITIEPDVYRSVAKERLSSSYKLLFDISQLLYEHASLNEESGKFTFKDFSRDHQALASLFEKFVFNFFKKEQSKFIVRRENISWEATPINNSDLSLLPNMQTDITLESNDNKIIIDTKFYKNATSTYFSKESFNSSNLYQIYSYLNNLEKDKKNINNANCSGILLYPTVDKEIDEQYQMGDHKIRLATVDLSKDWKIISQRLLSLVA